MVAFLDVCMFVRPSVNNIRIMWKSIKKSKGSALRDYYNNIAKITNMTFTHERVIKIKCPQNLENFIFRDEKKKWNLDFREKNRFSILRFVFNKFKIFQISRFWDFVQTFSKFSDFQILFKHFNIFSDFRILFSISDFSKFRDFQFF